MGLFRDARENGRLEKERWKIEKEGQIYLEPKKTPGILELTEFLAGVSMFSHFFADILGLQGNILAYLDWIRTLLFITAYVLLVFFIRSGQAREHITLFSVIVAPFAGIFLLSGLLELVQIISGMSVIDLAMLLGKVPGGILFLLLLVLSYVLPLWELCRLYKKKYPETYVQKV